MNTASQLFRCCTSSSSPLCSRLWRQFVESHDHEIRRIVTRTLHELGLRLGVEHELDDYVQELYCRLLAGSGRNFRGFYDDELWSYLSRMARNLVVDRWRQGQLEKRRRVAKRTRRQRRQQPWQAALLPELGALPKTPEEQLLLKERQALLLTTCGQLIGRVRGPLRQRALLLALLGHSSREIVAAVDGQLTARQVDLLIFRLRRRLARDGIRLSRRNRATRRRRRQKLRSSRSCSRVSRSGPAPPSSALLDPERHKIG